MKVIIKINNVVKKFATYFAWCKSQSKLKRLDGLLINFFKKYLIKKFRNKGMRRPV